MNKYELMYIIDTALEDEPRKELIERVSALITGNGGEVEKVDEWGKRRLAYAINYKNEGYYVLVNFSASSDLPREIERVLQISEDVLRYLIVRVEEKHTSVKPRPVPVRPAPAARPVETAPAAAEPAAEPVEEAQAPAEEAPAVEQE
ncbi:MAG: 30S ribosomal protein S6 [Christensenellales bacterium]|mgnify:CR=1 FL=1|uniref:Small ribosomal subunit protein bS6 n=1 Tax=Candidatus Avichristensenella intestinipullorum TaxID=2840693 RepID=A0A9D0YXX4_9FIRM|nr:30S ribosomal protein S6 [Christensenellales bacterium]HIQ63968.1 30S ribosomal protein S6 [Candidatus Avichristensenella intestinipullorum]